MPIDYKTYHPNWKKISYFLRKYRAKNKCESCGAKNGKPHHETGKRVVLTVAHLDRDIKNNSFFNLRVLCRRCHLNYDRKDNIRRRKLKRLKGQLQLFKKK